MFAVFLLLTVVCQSWAYSPIDSWVISAAMRQTSAISILAAKLNDVMQMSVTDCLLLCAADATCVYVTFDDESSHCSLYAAGTTIYTVGSWRVYASEKKLQVQYFYFYIVQNDGNIMRLGISIIASSELIYAFITTT